MEKELNYLSKRIEEQEHRIKRVEGYAAQQSDYAQPLKELRREKELLENILNKLNGNLTDLEKFVDTYKQYGIKVKINTNEKGGSYIVLGYAPHDPAEVTQSPFFGGNIGFYTTVIFDDKGKFVRQNFWE